MSNQFVIFRNFIDIALRGVLVVLLVTIAALVSIQAIMRYGFGMSISGSEELTILVVVWLYFSGSIYATLRGGHISGGFELGALSNSTGFKLALAIISQLISLLVLGAFCWLGYRLLESTYFSNFQSVSLALPKWIWSASLITGFAISFFIVLAQIISSFVVVIRRSLGKNV